MKTIMARTPHESSFSFSRRYFLRRKKVSEDDEEEEEKGTDEEEEEEILRFISGRRRCADAADEKEITISHPIPVDLWGRRPRTKPIAKLKSALSPLFGPARCHHRSPNHLGSKVMGTLFGHRRGHVRFAIQESPKSGPAFLMELSTPTSVLVREMASGMVRIALECDKKLEKRGVGLLEEPLWRAYCNGRKCGYAMRRECGAEEWRVLRAVEPISMGAGVLPVAAEAGDGALGSEETGGGGGGEVMYMRAKFERVVGSKDSEAFYMMNPNDGGYGCPELSLYLLRV